MKKFNLFIFICAILVYSTKAQIVVVPDSNAVQLVNSFVLSGVTVSNVLYTGGANTLAQFSGGSQTNLGLDNGIALTTGTFDPLVFPHVGSPVTGFASYQNNSPGDALLNTLISGFTTYDAAILEFNLVPAGNVLEFNYVFASEEYPEFVSTGFNDVFGFFISGPDTLNGLYVNENIAVIPGTTIPIAINNIHANSFSQFYVDNQALGGQTIVYDGFTTVLTAKLFVVPGATYHLKMAVADAGDDHFDSAIFLKANSMKSYNSVITAMCENSGNNNPLFPNPADDQLFIQASSYPVVFTIADITGKSVYSGIIESPTTPVNVSMLEPGLYFVKTTESNGKTLSSTLLLQR